MGIDDSDRAVARIGQSEVGCIKMASIGSKRQAGDKAVVGQRHGGHDTVRVRLDHQNAALPSNEARYIGGVQPVTVQGQIKDDVSGSDGLGWLVAVGGHHQDSRLAQDWRLRSQIDVFAVGRDCHRQKKRPPERSGRNNSIGLGVDRIQGAVDPTAGGDHIGAFAIAGKGHDGVGALIADKPERARKRDASGDGIGLCVDYLDLVVSCLYGCFSRPQAVVYWGAAAALSQNLEGIPVEVCDRGGLPRVLGCVPLAGRFRMPALWEPTRLRTKASALAMFPMSAADFADGRYHPA